MDKGCCTDKDACGLSKRSGAPAAKPTTMPPLDHAQDIATLDTRLTAQFIHQGTHQINAATTDAQLARVEVGNCGQIERGAFVEDMNLHPVGPKITIDLHLRLGPVVMGVTHDVADRLVKCKNDCFG